MHKFYLLYILCLPVILCRANSCEEFQCNEEIYYDENTCTLQYYDCSEELEFIIDLGYYDSVYELKFYQSNVPYIPHGIFVSLPNVKILQLSDCNVSKIIGDEFESATNLYHLNLAKNDLTELEDALFHGAYNLIEINLEHNQISHINANAFESLSKLKNINLSYNRIVTIPDKLFAHLALNQLNLNNNQITNIRFGADVAVNNLTINDNELITMYLDRNTSVKLLQAKNNKLRNISISDGDLTELSLKNNSLLDFNFIQNMSNLLHLDLSFNPGAGKSIAGDTLAKLTNLITLDLESVNLPKLNFQLFSLNLEMLDISYNDLTSIDFHMLTLKKLKRLYINGNSLTKITVTEIELLFPNLEIIDISDNNWQCDQLVEILLKLQQTNVTMKINVERLDINETNIRGIRCHQNTSEWSSVTKIPVQYNDDTVNAAEINETKSQLNELQQQNENLQFELTEFLNMYNLDKNRATLEMNQTKTHLNELQRQIESLSNILIEILIQIRSDRNGTTLKTTGHIQNLQYQIDMIKMTRQESNQQSDKLLRPQQVIESDLADDVKFIKILLLVFLIAGICIIGLMCFRNYLKRSRGLIHPRKTRTHQETALSENSL